MAAGELTRPGSGAGGRRDRDCDVRIELDTETVWHPGRMGPAARASLARRRAALAAGVIPHAQGQ